MSKVESNIASAAASVGKQIVDHLPAPYRRATKEVLATQPLGRSYFNHVLRHPEVAINDARVALLEISERPKVLQRIEMLGRKNSSLPEDDRLKHVGIILDGNRRDGKAHGLSTPESHLVGGKRVVFFIKPFVDLGVTDLSLWGASTGNFDSRTPEEMVGVCNSMENALDMGLNQIVDGGGRIIHIGRTDRITKSLKTKLQDAMDLTANNRKFRVWIQADYSGEYQRAKSEEQMMKLSESGLVKTSDLNWDKIKWLHQSQQPVRPMQLMIRTGVQNAGNLVNFSGIGEVSEDAYMHSIRDYLPHSRTSQFVDGIEDWFATNKRRRA